MYTSVVTTAAIVVIIAFCAGVGPVAHARQITFGISVGGNSAARVAFHRDIERGLNYTCDWINRFPEIHRRLKNEGDESFTCAMRILRDAGNTTRVYANYLSLARDPTVDFIIAAPPTTDAVSLGVLDLLIAEGRDAIVGAMDSRSAFYDRGGYGAPPSSVSSMYSAIPLLVTAGVKTAAILTVAGDLQRETCQGFENQVFYNRITVASSQVIPSLFDLSQPTDQALVRDAVDRLVASKADVVVVCAYNAVLEFVIRELRTRNYSPRAILTSTIFDPFQDESLRHFVISLTTTIQERAQFPPIPLWGTGLDFHNRFTRVYGVPPSDSAVKAYLTMHIYFNAIMKAGASDQTRVLAALRQTHFDSLVGKVIFGADRQNLLDNMVYQIVPGDDAATANSTDTIIAGPALATSGRLVYPFPKWDRRISDHTWGKPADIVGLVVIIFMCLFVVSGVIGLVVVWNQPLTVRASRYLVLTAHIGALALMLSFIAWMPGTTSGVACGTRAILTNLSATLTLMPLVLKAWRLAKIFSASSLKVFRISDARLFAILSGAVSLALACGILLVALSEFRLEEVEPVRYERADNYLTCGSSDLFTPFLIVNLIWALVAFFAVIIVIVRVFINIPVDYESARAEGMPLLVGSGVSLLSAAMSVTVQLIMPADQYSLKYILTVCFVAAGVLVVLGFVDGSLFWRIRRGDTVSSRSSAIRPLGSQPSTDIGMSFMSTSGGVGGGSTHRASSSLTASPNTSPVVPSRGGNARDALKQHNKKGKKKQQPVETSENDKDEDEEDTTQDIGNPESATEVSA